MRVIGVKNYSSKYDGWYICLLPAIKFGVTPACMGYSKSVWMSIEWLLWDVQITWGGKDMTV